MMLSGGLGAAGALEALDVHHCTIGASAGGLAAGLAVGAGATLGAITIAASVIGAIALSPGVQTIVVTDSIVGEDRSADEGAGVLTAALAIDGESVDATIARCTLFGRVRARTVDLDHVLATGTVSAARRQEGCVRYSLVPPGSRTAQRFRCQPDLAIAAAGATTPDAIAAAARAMLPRFTASRWEHPAFAQLHALCPGEIAAGGAGGLEIGALASFGGPVRLANLGVALGDTLRVGLEAGVFTAT